MSKSGQNYFQKLIKIFYLFYFSFLTTILTPLDPLPIPANALNPAAGLSTYQAPPREKYTNILGIFCKLDSLIFTSACYDMTWNNMSTFPPSRYKNLILIFSCSCSGGNVCSLTRDALQQNSFVFYCRPKETSKFRFETTFFGWILNIFVPQISWWREELKKENIKMFSFFLKIFQ